MKNIIRKILEFIKKIIPFIIIIAIICIIKFHSKFLTITDFLGITNKQEDISNLISYIELMIEFGFLYLVLKEFKITRKSFEWKEEEQREKKEKELYKKIRYLIKIFYSQLENYIVKENTNVFDNKNETIEWINKRLKKAADVTFSDRFCNELIEYLNNMVSKKVVGGINNRGLYNFIADKVITTINGEDYEPILKIIRKQCFTNDKEIEKLFNTITKQCSYDDKKKEKSN